MNLGFSYIGLIFLLMLMIPNIIWSKNKPKDYEKYEKNENKILLALERIGEVGNTCLALMFTDFNINNISYWSTILFIALLLMILYEIYWIRYFKSNKTMKDMYSSILGIPVAWKKYISYFFKYYIRNRTYRNTLKSQERSSINYDLSSCSQAANNYMNQVLSSSNIDLSGYVEPYQENGVIVGYKVLFK